MWFMEAIDRNVAAVIVCWGREKRRGTAGVKSARGATGIRKEQQEYYAVHYDYRRVPENCKRLQERRVPERGAKGFRAYIVPGCA